MARVQGSHLYDSELQRVDFQKYCLDHGLKMQQVLIGFIRGVLQGQFDEFLEKLKRERKE
ncbi:MAG: hypothetical protein ABSC17_10590 [Thermacetogeniaceae bacterium]